MPLGGRATQPNEPRDTATADGVSLQARARDAIKTRVLRGEYPPGSPLSEEALAADLEMSRTPVRQALQELANRGLLERYPGRGVTVRRIDVRKMLDIIDVQHCLLRWSVAKACTKSEGELEAVFRAFDRQVEGTRTGDQILILHEGRAMDVAIVAAGGNTEMVRFMREISDLVVHAASQSLTSFDQYSEAVREHEEIIGAIRAHDVDRAEVAVDSHCAGIRRRLLGTGS